MPNSQDFNRFSINPVNIDISRSLLNLDHSVKFSCNVGECIPFDCIEVLPGDTFTIDTSKVIRLQPLVAPIMQEIFLDVYYFYIPNRLVWSHWKEFMGENNESAWAPATEYNIPTLQAPSGGWNVGTIADYLGVPVGASIYPKVSALPFRAYALVMDQWFRSEAVMDPVHCFVDDSNRTGSNGNNQVTDIELGGKPFIACKYFDYFTGALPSPQRGDAATIKIIRGNYNFFPVITDDDMVHPYDAGKTTSHHGVHATYKTKNGNTISDYNKTENLYVSPNGLTTQGNPGEFTSYDVFFDNLFARAENSMFNNVSINDLRTAFAIQKYLEKQARYGGRYQEFIKAFFGVDSPDARLQRTEYLGGSRISLNINSVEQTSATSSGSTPLGNVAGMSVTGDSHSDFSKSFTEHGMILGIAVCRYEHSYQDSIHKMWTRKTPYEFYNPVFANIGETPIKISQLYGYVGNDGTFGYQEAWAEYRYIPSRVSGEMRSVYSTPLDMWHLADHYVSEPSLSPEWLREDKSNLDRCLAVTSDVSNQVICDFYIKTAAARPMPLYSIPGLIDHH